MCVHYVQYHMVKYIHTPMYTSRGKGKKGDHSPKALNGQKDYIKRKREKTTKRPQYDESIKGELGINKLYVWIGNIQMLLHTRNKQGQTDRTRTKNP